MDVNLNFSSDSTYCSSYENANKRIKGKCKPNSKLRDSKFLDKIHKEIILHLEGKVLIGRLEVVQYMKQISKMKFHNVRDQYFAEKIKSTLLKIYNLTKQFERSFISKESLLSDPIENYSFTQDIKKVNVNVKNPKQILLQTKSVTDEKSSFPLEILTNNNFIMSLSHPSVKNPSVSENEIAEKNRQVKTKNNEIEHSSDLFSSESFVSLKVCSVADKEKIVYTQGNSNTHSKILNPNKALHFPMKHTETGSENIHHDENMLNRTSISDNMELSQDVAIKQNVIENSLNSPEECNTILQITKLCQNLHMENGAAAEFFDNKNELVNAINVDLKTVKDLDNIFNESYNTKIYEICCDIVNNLNKNWQQFEQDIKSKETFVKNAHHSLDKLFEKQHLEELSTNDIKFVMLRDENTHSVQSDERTLDMKDLMNTNKVRLKQLSKEFQMHLNSRQKKSIEEENAFQVLNWKKIIVE